MAEYLLSTRCYPISKVARLCGYASVSYFTMYLDVILCVLQVNTLRGVQKVKFLLTGNLIIVLAPYFQTGVSVS